MHDGSTGVNELELETSASGREDVVQMGGRIRLECEPWEQHRSGIWFCTQNPRPLGESPRDFSKRLNVPLFLRGFACVLVDALGRFLENHKCAGI